MSDYHSDLYKAVKRDQENMVAKHEAEYSALRDKILELREALHNLVEACFRADNEGELASEIDGSLMDAAWKALK